MSQKWKSFFIILLLATIIIKIELSNRSNGYSVGNQNKQRNLFSDVRNPITEELCENREQIVDIPSNLFVSTYSNPFYRSLFGPEIGEYIFHLQMPPGSKMVQKYIFVSIILLFVLITPILMGILCCNFICDKSCPLCCRRDPQQNPFTSREHACMLIFVILYCAFIFATSIAGVVSSVQIRNSYLDLKCEIVMSLDRFNLGYKLQNSTGDSISFLGLTSLETKLENINKEINQYLIDMNSFITIQRSNIQTLNDIQGTFNSMMNSLTQSQAIANFNFHVPNQSSGGNADIYSSGLTSNQASSFFGVIPYRVRVSSISLLFRGVSEILIQAINQSLIAANTLVNIPQSQINSLFERGIDQVDNVQLLVDRYLKWVDDNLDQIDIAIFAIEISLLVIYILLIILTIVACIFTSIGYSKEWNAARYILHTIWIILGFLTILCLIIAAVLTVLTVGLIESCEETQKVITDQNYLRTLGIDDKFVDYIALCMASLQGDGNLLAKLGIEPIINNIESVQNNLIRVSNNFETDAYEHFLKIFESFENEHKVFEETGINYSRGSNTNFNQVSPSVVGDFSFQLDYPLAQSQFLQYQRILLASSSPPQSFTSSTCLQGKYKDFAVFRSDQCRNLPQKMPGQWPPLSGQTECVVLSESITNQITQEMINQRYSGCSDEGQTEIFKEFYEKVQSYIKFMRDKYGQNQRFAFNKLINSVSTPQVENTKKRSEFIHDINTSISLEPTGFGGILKDFKSYLIGSLFVNTKQITEQVVGNDGISKNSNCLFIELFTFFDDCFVKKIEILRERTCRGLANSIFSSLQILLVVSFSTFTLVILLYKMAMRFYGDELIRSN